MAIRQALLPEFDHEMANTRKTLERVPEQKFAWKPHEKSMTMQHLSIHLAHMPVWAVHTVKEASLDLAPSDGPPYPAPRADSVAEILAMFDANVSAARAALDGADDPHLLRDWSLLKGGRTLFTMPRIAVIRSFVMNHIIHHRAQLGVYLRLNDIPVPSLYGPSADEGQM